MSDFLGTPEYAASHDVKQVICKSSGTLHERQILAGKIGGTSGSLSTALIGGLILVTGIKIASLHNGFTHSPRSSQVTSTTYIFCCNIQPDGRACCIAKLAPTLTRMTLRPHLMAAPRLRSILFEKASRHRAARRPKWPRNSISPHDLAQSLTI